MKILFVLVIVITLITIDIYGQPVSITASIPYGGTNASGTYMVYRASNIYNIPLTNLRKPFILVEGFDPNGDYAITDIYGMIQGNFANRLHNLGYDIIVLNFENGGDYIQRNAFLLVELINQINANKPNSEQLVVAGFSMGGLVARYALTYMEQHGISHQTRLYMSLDSPQKGAHVPVGVQALALSFNYDIYKLMFPDLQLSLNMFQAPAAKQMLKYRLTSPDQTDGEILVNTDFTNFFNELNNLNSCSGFPQNCRNIGISLGNWNGRSQRSNIDSDGDGYGDFQQSGMPMFDINIPRGTGGTQSIWNASTCDIIAAFTFQARVGTMYSDNYPGFSTRSSSFWNLGNYFCASYWYANPNGSPLVPYGAYQHAWQYKNKEAMDFAPGSYVPIGSDIVTSMNSQINCSFAYVSNNTFIPTVSSLCFDSENLFYDIGNDPNKLNKTPFDAIYGLSGDNTSHRSGQTTNTDLVNWLIDQVSGNYAKTKSCCPYLPSFTFTVSGPSPSMICSTGNFSVNQVPTNCTITWNSSSNISLPSNRNTNPIIATAFGNGEGWIQPTILTSCGSVILPQYTVWVGTPQITNQKVDGNYYSPGFQICPGNHWLNVTPVGVNAGTATWTVPGNIPYSVGTNLLNFTLPSSASSVAITVRSANNCGTSSNWSFYLNKKSYGCSGFYGMTIYPNPASDNVTITLDNPISSNTIDESDLSNIGVTNSVNMTPLDYTINIYNNQSMRLSSVKRTGNSFNIPLVNMRDGTYIIEVTDGKNSYKQQLIVKRN